MNNNSRINLEKIVNGLVMVAIVFVLGVVIKKHWFDSGEPTQNVAIGQKVEFPEINWKLNGQTVVLAVSRNCSHCTASMPFFGRLQDEALRVGIEFEVISGDSIEVTKNYFAESNVQIRKAHQVNLFTNGISGTPMLLFINHQGVVKDTWAGRVNDNNFEMILKKLTELSNPDPDKDKSTTSVKADYPSSIQSLRPAELQAMLDANNDVMVIDVDAREHFGKLNIPNSRNIPTDEIISRAAREIPKDKRIIFYGRCDRDSGSINASEQLTKLGYSNVSFLEGGLQAWKNAGLVLNRNSTSSPN